MDFLVFGETGQVAQELARLPVAARFVPRAEADLTGPGAAGRIIAAARPGAVINAAAFTDVDGAETAIEAAMAVNGLAPGEMARACAALGIPFVHISTDYVFDGSGREPFAPDDGTGPLGIYGRSKLAGEKAVRKAGGAHAVLRTSWVFSAHGRNFVKTMLRLAKARPELTVVADQTGGPTPAGAIAKACIAIAEALHRDPGHSGAYHLSGAPDVSWADFARAIFDAAGLAVRVQDIPTTAFPTPARRPANSRLDCNSTTEVFGIERPDWRAALTDLLKELAVAP